MTRLATAHGGALVLPTFDGVRELRTARTLLRGWMDSDLEPWVAMNADLAVRRHFPGLLTRDEALAEAARIRATLQRRGWGAWALEIPGALPFAHPRLAPEHPMSRHVLYRLRRGAGTAGAMPGSQSPASEPPATTR
ncbi:MAG: hypothetical protein LCI02_02795 [Proteobacteria bacterium]|nr:hypothetical protein [Pseudomonadota bacterium]